MVSPDLSALLRQFRHFLSRSLRRSSRDGDRSTISERLVAWLAERSSPSSRRISRQSWSASIQRHRLIHRIIPLFSTYSRRRARTSCQKTEESGANHLHFHPGPQNTYAMPPRITGNDKSRTSATATTCPSRP